MMPAADNSTTAKPLCYAQPGLLTPPPRCRQARVLHEKHLEGRSIDGCQRCVAHPNEKVHGFRCFPAVIIIGVMKSGTTELYDQARNHPHLHTANREQHFYTDARIKSPSSWHEYLWGDRAGAYSQFRLRYRPPPHHL